VKLSSSGLLGSVLDGVILGAILAIILVANRGPLIPDPKEQKKRHKHRRKPRQSKPASVPNSGREAKLGDYLAAWAMLGVMASSASYAVAGGHGDYGFITGTIEAFRTVSDPARLGVMMALNMLAFGAMGAILWTGVWWITVLLLRLTKRSWAERTKIIHGTLFGLTVGTLMGFSVCVNEAIAGNIVSPIDLLF